MSVVTSSKVETGAFSSKHKRFIQQPTTGEFSRNLSELFDKSDYDYDESQSDFEKGNENDLYHSIKMMMALGQQSLGASHLLCAIWSALRMMSEYWLQ